MDTKMLSDIMNWLSTTDLTEFVYKKNGHSIEIKTKESEPAGSSFESILSPVTSPAVGIYYASYKGKTASLKEEQDIKEGDFMGVVAMPSSTHNILANRTGKLRIISVRDGKAVEYGQPLFFIEP
ncbi:acetyl-CoA carboxylase biotin carboxyl carrier protein [Parelusimicrobium proximum]|uniref:acetyl-CoA carboxylase biotin carboxyl carrier protein n=1 Tax=Parelusimicrobium proximum TaxID=3228953 RepID=UPI003D176FE9